MELKIIIVAMGVIITLVPMDSIIIHVIMESIVRLLDG
jgi:hypothetical protein